MAEQDPITPPEPQDDAIIGRALRWSLLAIAAAVVVALALFFWLRRTPAETGGQETEAALPTARIQDVQLPSLPFYNWTAEAGVNFVHANGAAGDKLLPETMGGGVAFFDYDNDGDADLLLVNGDDWPDGRGQAKTRPTMALYRNDGSGRYDEVAAESGLAVSLYGMGVAVGDVDGDGWRDLFIAAVGGNRLFRNAGGRFEDITERAGVGGDPGAWSSSAGFFDYDRDGDLDLFVCNYVTWSREIDLANDFQLTGVGRAYGPPTNFAGAHPYLYRNEGDGVFSDASAAAGVQVNNPATGAPMAKALALAMVDYDRDGWIDVMVANDTVQNFCFHNQGDGTFRERGAEIGVAFDRNGQATGAMGADVAFYRNDDALGVAIGNFANEMTSLYVSQGPSLFADEAIGEGIGPGSRLALTFGVLFFDVDLDGRLDLVQANGHLEEEINKVQASQRYRQSAQLFWNTGQGRSFALAKSVGDLDEPIVGRGAAFADIDNDGDLDLALTQIAGPPLLLRNDQALANNWARVRLADEGGNPDGIGARVELTAGGRTQYRHIIPTRSYLSQVPAEAFFGLGEAAVIDRIRVMWPDGAIQEETDLSINQVHRIPRRR